VTSVLDLPSSTKPGSSDTSLGESPSESAKRWRRPAGGSGKKKKKERRKKEAT